MFSGIIEEKGRVLDVRGAGRERVVSVALPSGWRFANGESVSVEGVCSTVQKRTKAAFEVVYMRETLKRTTLGSLERGSPVNLERSLRLNDLVGGHLVQGHVDTTGTIRGIKEAGSSRIYEFQIPQRYMRYVVEKGSVAIDGVSLTVVATRARGFSVSLLAYTLERTTLGSKMRGARVNIEVDLMAKYLERLIQR
jgi:riboflavin synthase